MIDWTAPWVWLASGLVLGILEILIPGYVLLGFAISAVFVGVIFFLDGFLASFLGQSLPMTLAFFGALAVLAWIVMRQVFGRRGSQPKIWEKDINDN